MPPPPTRRSAVPLYSDVCRNWIINAFYSIHSVPARQSALRDALSTMHAHGVSQNTTTQVPTRLGSAPGQVLLDLADDSKHIVRDRMPVSMG